jgi:hypothetical protein
MRQPYICPYCDQRSARRWNLDVHIKRRHGGYLLDRSSGRSLGIYSPWYRPIPYHSIEPATVADNIGDTFQPKYIPQQRPMTLSQHPASPKYSPMQIMADQRSGHGLSQGTILKRTKKIAEHISSIPK